MAGQTSRFAFNFFGADTPGSFDDDGDKYTGEDRLALDRILAAFEGHNHHLSTGLDEPDDEPDLDVIVGAGDLDGGTTYHYVISFVNADGLETVSGPEVSIETPDLLATPDAPAAETSTVALNTLTAGLYFYALTGLRDDEESALGDPVAVTVLTGENTTTLTLPALGDATTYQVWRMKDTDPGWTRIATTATGTYIDTGAVAAGAYGDPANIPPGANTGASTYAITITLTGDDLTRVLSATAWRIYRTEVSGLYDATSLVHEVIERIDDLNPLSALLTFWTDAGDVQLTGSPKVFSSELSIAPFTFETASPLPAAAGYPDNYPITDATGALFVKHSGAWQSVASGAGVHLFTGSGDPSPEPSGAIAGDVYINSVNGDIWILDGV